MASKQEVRPLVSITMATYNGQVFLAETIESIRAQTLDDWELVAVDDGSTDNSLELLKQFAAQDSRIKVYQHSRNRGHRAASNTAFGLARGRYVARTDQDDLSLPHRLESQVRFLEAKPEVGLLASGHYRLYPDGRRVPVRKVRDPALVRWGFLFNNAYCHSTFMFRREFVSGPNPYRYAPSAFDYEVCARLAWETQIRALAEPLVCYRVHSGGLASTDTENMNVAALAISSREIRRLLQPKRLTRSMFCGLRRLATGVQVKASDLEFLPDLLTLMSRYQIETGISEQQLKMIWRRIIRRLVAALPTASLAVLAKHDPLGVGDSLLVSWHRAAVRPARRKLGALVPVAFKNLS